MGMDDGWVLPLRAAVRLSVTRPRKHKRLATKQAEIRWENCQSVQGTVRGWRHLRDAIGIGGPVAFGEAARVFPSHFAAVKGALAGRRPAEEPKEPEGQRDAAAAALALAAA